MKKFYQLFILLFVLTAYSQPNTTGMYFNGATEITVPNTTNINSATTNNRTYETYFKANDVSAGKRFIMKEGGSTRAVMIYTENGYLYLGAYNRADYTPDWEGTFYRTPISSGVWYHIALVFDNALAANTTTNTMNVNANTALKFYLNGTLVIQKSGYQLGNHNSIRLGYKNEDLRLPTGTWTTSGSAEYVFGNNANDTNNNTYYFRGNIWGFRVWNDVRTQAEINNNKNNLILNVGTDDLVAVLDGNDLTYLDSSNVPVEATTTAPPTLIWKANAATTDWETNTNWVGDVAPNNTLLQSITIVSSTNYPIINSTVIVGDLTVNTGATVTVKSNNSLTVNFDVTNNGNIFLENNANFIQQKNTAGSGIMEVKRNTNQLMRLDYTMWSSPVTSQNLLNFSPSTLTNRFYTYNTATNLYNTVSTSGSFATGKGYLIRMPNDFTTTPTVWTGTFLGTPNNGSLDVALSTAANGYNAVGNPYPSTIDMAKFVADNSANIGSTLYFWRKTNSTETTQAYSTWNNGTFVSNGEAQVFNPNGTIQVGQGFIVKAIGSSLNFNNTQRKNNNDNQFFRQTSNETETGKYWLNLTSTSNEFAQMAVTYSENATDGLDYYDGEYFNSGSISLNSLINNDLYAIQGKSLFNSDDVVSLGLNNSNSGTYTISLDHVEGLFQENQDILLHDKTLNILTNLKNDSYTFTSNAGTDNNRFEVLYQNVRLATNISNYNLNNIIVYKSNNTLVIKANEEVLESVKIFDINGRLLSETKSINASEAIIHNLFSNQILLVQISTSENNIVTKKIVN